MDLLSIFRYGIFGAIGLLLYLGLAGLFLQEARKDEYLMRKKTPEAWFATFFWFFPAMCVFIGAVLQGGGVLLLRLVQRKHPFRIEEDEVIMEEAPQISLSPSVQAFLDEVQKKKKEKE